MHQKQFDALVGRLSLFARQHAARYKLHVALLAVLGYSYIFVILLGLLAALTMMIWLIVTTGRINVAIVKLIVIVGIPIFIVINSLWVKFAPPIGLELSRPQYPSLFALIDELTSKLQAPKFHCVLLTEEFNAAVTQVPRLGIFGWQQNYLILGLPLMQALSPMQFRAVLAHELGHLSGNHSRFAGWIYRLRITWVQLLARLEQGGQDSVLAVFKKFFDWYVPFFSAYSFVLGRSNEYEADRCAAVLAGENNVAEALIAVEVKARFLERTFWPSIYQQVEYDIEPPQSAFTNMFAALGNEVTEDANKWLEQSLAQKTNNADTHPCLSDRLAALGYFKNGAHTKLPLPELPKVSAAREFLGANLEQLTEYLNSTWKEKMATPWRQRFAYTQEAHKNLQFLAKTAQIRALTAEEAWNRACWTAELQGHEKAIALFYEVLTIQPDHAAANYTIGQFLIQQQDATGVEYIDKAMQAEADYVLSGCELVYFFLKQQGKLETAKAYQNQAEQHYALVLKAQQERSSVEEKNSFAPHNLPNANIENLQHQLSQYPEIKQAYLVQKVVQYFPEKPFYILGVVRDRHWWQLGGSDKDQELVEQLVQEFANNTFIIILNDNNQALKRKICKIEGAAIYTQKTPR